MGRRVAFVVSISLGALLVLLVAADAGLRALSQYYVSRSIQSSLDLDERPSVSLGGFPFTVRLLSGDLPSVSVRAQSVIAEGVRLDRVDLTLHGVDVSAAKVLSNSERSIHAKSGDGTATMTADDLTQALDDQGIPVTVEFSGGDALVSADGLSGAVKASVSLSGASLVLKPVSAELPVSVSLLLPEVVKGIRYTSVHIDGSVVTLSFTLTDPDFTLPSS
jgi:hypothetical protein